VRRRPLLLALVALACAPGRTRIPGDATHTVISLQDIDCESCGTRVVEAAQDRDGVYAAAFDRTRAEVSIHHDATRVDAPALLALARGQRVKAVLGAGQGRYLPVPTYPAGADVRTIAKGGELVVIESHLAEGKVTVFDFYAPWCQPCRKVDAHLGALLSARSDVAVRKLDVADWDTPLARHSLARVPTLPYVVVYGKDGTLIAEISGLDLAGLDRAIADGAR